MEKTIELIEALAGFQFIFHHLDGREILVKSNPGDVVKPGDTRLVRDEGMPLKGNPLQKGSMYIKFNIKFPDAGFFKGPALEQLGKLLPPRPAAPKITNPDTAEEVFISKTSVEPRGDPRHQHGGHEEEGDSDEDGGGRGGPGVQCAQQ
jgi:DnaJ family protein A protein 2